MTFNLLPAVLADVPTLGDIFKASFATDAHTLVKLIDQDSKDMVDGMKEAIESWIEKPQRCNVTKAVEKDGITIMGWIAWGFHGYEEVQTYEASESSIDVKRQEESTMKQNELQSQNEKLGGIKEMESFTNKDMDRWMKKIMPKKSKCMYIVSIAVDPKFQSRGVGSALIQEGTMQADKDNVLCWVHSSEAGHKIFLRNGFEIKETLEIDLDKYASSPPQDKQRWGLYTFRYMVRPART